MQDTAEKEKIAFPMPIEPDIKSVTFEKGDNSLILSFDNYRKLEGNIIEYRRYISELESLVKYYRGDDPSE